MFLHQLLDAVTPEQDPDRRGAQIMLGVAWAMLPNADLDEVIDFAASLIAPSVVLERATLEQVALGMYLERGEA